MRQQDCRKNHTIMPFFSYHNAGRAKAFSPKIRTQRRSPSTKFGAGQEERRELYPRISLISTDLADFNFLIRVHPCNQEGILRSLTLARLRFRGRSLRVSA